MNSCTKKVVELWTGTEHPQKPAELLTWNAPLTGDPNDVFSNHRVFLHFCHSLSHKLPGIGSSGHQFIDDFRGAQSLKQMFSIQNARKMNFCTEKVVELRTGKHQYLTYLSNVSCFAKENTHTHTHFFHGVWNESSYTSEPLEREPPHFWTIKTRAPILSSIPNESSHICGRSKWELLYFWAHKARASTLLAVQSESSYTSEPFMELNR